MDNSNRLPTVLFLLRLSIFIVMFIWTIDKFIRPEHAATVFKHFYHISSLSPVVSYLIGTVEMVIIIGFLLGFMKRFTYGAVLVLHGISTLSSYGQYLSPFEGPNLLFFAAWPMLAACFGLYYMRDHDTLLALEKKNVVIVL